MIILDTNIVSELMREQPSPAVADWIQSFDPNQFTITSITVAEILRGLARMAEGKRRRKLEQSFDGFIHDAFSSKILAFDEQAALLYGEISAGREKKGLPVDPVDLMITAIAKNHNAAIATRNIKDFEACGIKIINPWKLN